MNGHASIVQNILGLLIHFAVASLLM